MSDDDGPLHYVLHIRPEAMLLTGAADAHDSVLTWIKERTTLLTTSEPDRVARLYDLLNEGMIVSMVRSPDLIDVHFPTDAEAVKAKLALGPYWREGAHSRGLWFDQESAPRKFRP